MGALNPSEKDDSAAAIQQRMDDIRTRLGADVDDIVHSVKSALDWRVFMRKHPWGVLGAAMALGFVAVPKRTQASNGRTGLMPETTPGVGGKEQASSGGVLAGAGGALGSALLRLAAKTATREFMSYLGNRKMASQGAPASGTIPGARPPDYVADRQDGLSGD